MKNKFILVTFFSIFLLFSPSVKAANYTDNQIVDKNKDWTIKFSDNVCLDDLTKNAIVIKDLSGNILDLNISLCADGKSVLIAHPYNGYTSGQDYTLCLGPNIHSLSGKKLKQQQVLQFGIPWLPIEDSNVDKVTLYGKDGEKEASKDEQVKIINLLNSIKSYDHYDYGASLHSWQVSVSGINIYTKDKNIIQITGGGSADDSIRIGYEYYTKQSELNQILNKLN